MYGGDFKVSASRNNSDLWIVSECMTRFSGKVVNVIGGNPGNIAAGSPQCIEPQEELPEVIEKGNADGNNPCLQDCSPMRTRWLLPLVVPANMEKPNISNSDMKELVKYYVKDKFVSNANMQNVRLIAREKFMDNHENVCYTNALVINM